MILLMQPLEAYKEINNTLLMETYKCGKDMKQCLETVNTKIRRVVTLQGEERGRNEMGEGCTRDFQRVDG